MGAKVSNYDKEERKFLSRSMNAPLLSKEQEQSLTKLWKKKWLNKALDSLDHREKIIINSRHICESPDTLEKIGKKLKISKERVRQIESSALNKLKLRIKSFVLEKRIIKKRKPYAASRIKFLNT